MTRRLLVAVALAVFAAQPAGAESWTTIFPRNVSVEDGLGWDFPGEARYAPNSGCNASTMALQRDDYSNGNCSGGNCKDQWLMASNFRGGADGQWVFQSPPGEEVVGVWPSVRGGTATGSGTEGFRLRIQNGSTNLAINTDTWSQATLMCSPNDGWRFGGAWDITSILSANNLLNDAGVNAIELWVRRENNTTRDMYVDAYRMQIRTLKITPGTPTLTISAIGAVTANSIAMSFSSFSGTIESYIIERSVSGGPFAVLTTVGAGTTYYVDTGLAEYTQYDYRVIAANSDRSSPYSNIAGARTLNTPHHLAFLSPLGSTTAGAPLSGVTVEVRDANGNPVATATNTITIALGSNPGGSTLNGTTGAAPIPPSGRASFTNLWLNRTGNGYTLVASSAGLGSATSSSFSVGPGNPAFLSFATQPADVAAGRPFSPSVAVVLLDLLGNVATTSTRTIQLTFNTNPGGSTLRGTTSRSTIAGIATFPDLWLDKAGAGYQLSAGDGTLSQLSTTFAVTAGNARKLAFLGQPSDAAALAVITPPVQVAVRDSLDNLVPSAATPVTVGLLGNPFGAVLYGNTTRAPAGGIATFDDLRIDLADATYKLEATAPALTAASSEEFRVVEYQARDSSYLAAYYQFEDADTVCRDRSWRGENRSPLTFAHVSGRFTVNDGFLSMGTKALWFGADSASAPAETGGWVYRTGFGNNWSQRLTSPPVSLSGLVDPVLSFVATVDFRDAEGLLDGDRGNEFLAVQGRRPDGSWVFLATRFTPLGGGAFVDTAIAGRGAFLAAVHLLADGNENAGLASPTSLRIVVQTDSAGSAEDGGVSPGRGAAQVDQVRIQDGASVIAPLVDFEDGGTGAWTLSAMNGVVRGPAPNTSQTRDLAAPATVVALRRGTEVGETEDRTCLWTFLAPGDQVGDGTFAHLASPWIGLPAGTQSALLGLSGRFYTQEHRRSVRLFVRGKLAGDSGPRFLARLPSWLTGGDEGGDPGTSFVHGAEYRFPESFVGAQQADSIQIVFEVSDRAETNAGGFTGRPSTRLPFVDRVYVTAVDQDYDNDGIANAGDACPTVSAAGVDADGDGCRSATETFNTTEYWPSTGGAPIPYVFSRNGIPAVVDGSEFEAVERAFATWTAVPGSHVSVVRGADVDQTRASSSDGLNLITFEDPLQDEVHLWDEGTLAVTTRTKFTRRGPFHDRLVLPGEIVDSDIRFNPNLAFSTNPLIPGADLQSVATHEIGHFLGLRHSPLSDATMYTPLPAGDSPATLEEEDRAALCALVPGASLASDFASIRGTVTRGTDASPVIGALVLAIRMSGAVPADTVAVDYTRPDGAYSLLRLTPGDYRVRVQPTSAFQREVVSAKLGSLAQFDFTAEYWNAGESGVDPLDQATSVTLAAGSSVTGTDVVTNVDVLPPTVRFFAPLDGATGVPVDAPIVLAFSEPIRSSTIAPSFLLRPVAGGAGVGGRGEVLEDTAFVFVPQAPLSPGTAYRLRIDATLTDRNGVPLADSASLTFTTAPAAAAPGIVRFVPARVAPGDLLTVVGDGFDAADSSGNRVVFPCSACPEIRVIPVTARRRFLTVVVPDSAVSGPVRVEVGGVASPSVPLVVTTGGIPVPAPSGSPVAVGFAPTDVEMAADGSRAWVVGDLGIATVDLTNGSRPVTSNTALGGISQLVAAADGTRGWVTQPGLGRVLELNLTPGGGLYPTREFTTGGQPDAIAVSPSGFRAYVIDTDANRVVELDVDAASPTLGRTLAVHAFRDSVLDGGIAVHPDGRHLLVSTRNAGILSVDLVADTVTSVVAGAFEAGRRSLSVTPDGRRMLLAGGAAGVVSLAGDPWSGPLAAAVVLSDEGCSFTLPSSDFAALAVATGTRRLVVVDLQGDAPAAAASSPTGRAPVAVATDAAGQIAAVCNQSDHTVSFYTLGGPASLYRVVPDVALPGEQVVAFSPVAGHAGASVKIGEQTLVPASTADSAAAFSVPALRPQRTAVAMASSSTTPTRSLPMDVVAPITAPAATFAEMARTPRRAMCAGDSGTRPLRFVRDDPSGQRIAALLGQQSVGACTLPAALEVFEAAAQDGQPGSSLASVALATGYEPRDARYTPDGGSLWIALDDGAQGMVQVIDTDPSSPGFGSVRFTISDADVGRAATLAADPLGRWMHVGSSAAGRIGRFSLAGAREDTISLGGHEARAIAVSGDGRWLVVGGEDRLWFYDAATYALAASSASTHPVQSLAVTRDGGRVVTAATTGRFGIWSLAPTPSASPLHFGASADGLVADIVPGPAAAGMLARVPGTARLVWIDAASPGTTQAVPIPRAATALAGSPGGRRLWVTHSGGAGSSNAPSVADSISLYGLAAATSLSIASGAGQTALAGTLLPLPLRVRVTDAEGNGMDGVPVRFSRAGATSGLLGPLTADTVAIRLTDVLGSASVSWTLGGIPGEQIVSVAALGLTHEFRATAVASDAETPPAVIATGPPQGAVGIAAGSRVYVRFNQKMDSTSVADRFQLTADGSIVAGTLEMQEDGRSFLFRPERPLPFSASCELSVAAGCMDRDGQSGGAPVTVGFTTEPPPALRITAVSPTAAAPGSRITVRGRGFSEVASENGVWLAGRRLNVTWAREDHLVCTLPQDLTTGALDLWVTVVSSPPTSPWSFTVLDARAPTSFGSTTIGAKPGGRDLVIGPDGTLAFVVNPASDDVDVFQITYGAPTWLRSIPVGVRPMQIAVDPWGRFAYVANHGSNDVSVLGVSPVDAGDYLRVVRTIPVGPGPRALSVVPAPERGDAFLVVVHGGDGTPLHLIDIGSSSAMKDGLVRTTRPGSTSPTTVVVQEGGSAWLATALGAIRISFPSLEITDTLRVPSGLQSLDLDRRSGQRLYGVDGEGQLVVLNGAEGSADFGRIVSRVRGPARFSEVRSLASGSGLMLNSAEAGKTFAYRVRGGSTTRTDGSSIDDPVEVDLIAAIDVGAGPEGLAIDPLGRFALVSGTGTEHLTQLSLDVQPPVTCSLDLPADLIELAPFSRWQPARIEPPSGMDPALIDPASIRLNSLVPVDTTVTPVLSDSDFDGLPEMTVWFHRDALPTVVPLGAAVPVTVTGTWSDRPFGCTQAIRSQRGTVTSPGAGRILPPGTQYLVTYDAAAAPLATTVKLLQSVDGGRNWSLAADGLPHTGSVSWLTPAAPTDSARLAVVQVEQQLSATRVRGVLALSGMFAIRTSAGAADDMPRSLTFAPIQPNPARGGTPLRFGLPRSASVRLDILDVQGRRVRTLVDGTRAPGWHQVDWNGDANRGRGRVGPGMYFARLNVDGEIRQHRFVLLY